jgi:hypothetical protein
MRAQRRSDVTAPEAGPVSSLELPPVGATDLRAAGPHGTTERQAPPVMTTGAG